MSSNDKGLFHLVEKAGGMDTEFTLSIKEDQIEDLADKHKTLIINAGYNLYLTASSSTENGLEMLDKYSEFS